MASPDDPSRAYRSAQYSKSNWKNPDGTTRRGHEQVKAGSHLDDNMDNPLLRRIAEENFTNALPLLHSFLDGEPVREEPEHDGTDLDRLFDTYVHQEDDRILLELLRDGRSHSDIATILGFPRKRMVLERLWPLLRVLAAAVRVEGLRPKRLPLDSTERLVWELYLRGVRGVDLALQIFPDESIKLAGARRRLENLLAAIRGKFIAAGQADYLDAAEDFRQANSGFRTGGGGRPAKRAKVSGQ